MSSIRPQHLVTPPAMNFSSSQQMWLHAMRLRTLPLSVAGILVGNALAWRLDAFHWQIALLSLSTAMLLQIVANLANDYGDGMNQADAQDRQGPVRITASGLVTPTRLLCVVLLACALTIVSGLALLGATWQIHGQINWSLWIALGSLSLVAALAYTVGAKPYGYRSLGDLAVLIFFGFVAVFGTAMLQVNHVQSLMHYPLFFASLAIGLWSVAVLNLNNMRDIESDARHGKITVAVRLGLRRAVRYQQTLILTATVSWFALLYDSLLNTVAYFLMGLGLWFLWRQLSFPWRQASAARYTQELQKLSRDVLIQVFVFTCFFNLFYELACPQKANNPAFFSTIYNNKIIPI